MNDKGKGKAFQERSDHGRINPREKLNLGPLRINDDHRSLSIRNPPSPYLDLSTMVDQQQYLIKDWVDIIMLANFPTKAAVEAMNKVKAEDKRELYLSLLEKRLEVAKIPIKVLITFEKQNSREFEKLSEDFECFKENIAWLKGCSGKAIQHYRTSLMYYSEQIAGKEKEINVADEEEKKC